MNTSVERKIASVAEKLEGVTYLFDNWATANVRLDKMPLPAIINLLPISGKFVISRTQLRDLFISKIQKGKIPCMTNNDFKILIQHKRLIETIFLY